MAIAVSVVGFDTAKNVFQVHRMDRWGETVLRRRLRRSQVADFFQRLTPCLIGMEATRGAHYWGRVLRAFGHDVRLMAPQFVKPYLKSQKNDANDAEAICESVSRPNMRFMPSKSIEQQDLQALHRIRSRMIGSRTQLGNQIRGLLAEYGIVLPLHLSQVRRSLPRVDRGKQPAVEWIRPTASGRSLRGTVRIGAMHRGHGRADSADPPQQRTLPEDRCCRRRWSGDRNCRGGSDCRWASLPQR
jgi:transposase